MIPTGETFQEMADIYLGTTEDFEWNPRIYKQKEKWKNIEDDVIEKWENPRILFCYTHRIETFIEKILPVVKNPFKLITHNSDHTIQERHYIEIANHPLFEEWYAQNIEFTTYDKNKLHILPIGFANEQWKHGNKEIIYQVLSKYSQKNQNSVYFNFNVETCPNKRIPCRNILINKGLKEQENTDFKTHLQRLQTYEYCICPEGNGPDTHRLWECIYMDVVPIVLKTPFIENLCIEYGESIPLIILEKWEDFSILQLQQFPTNGFTELHEKIMEVERMITN